jgi:DNA polymerase alpha-associated DNA helicase A
MAPSPISIPLFARAQQELLLKEHEAEKLSSALATSATTSVAAATRRTLQATGYALTGLVLEQCRTGMGGRVVGEFGPDAATSSTSAKQGAPDAGAADGAPRLGAHGIRVGDVVRVLEIASGTARKLGREKDKDGAKGRSSKEAEGVVIKASERVISIAFGQTGGGGSAKEEEEAVDELWGKKLWL